MKLNTVHVRFADPAHNYYTNVSAQATEASSIAYFVGKSFNMGIYPTEDFHVCTGIEFTDNNRENTMPIVYRNSPLKEQYNELLSLATFFRWSAGKPYNASGSRSPIDGKPYTNANGPHKVYEAGQKAMAKEYLRQAAIIRKTLIDLL